IRDRAAGGVLRGARGLGAAAHQRRARVTASAGVRRRAIRVRHAPALPQRVAQDGVRHGAAALHARRDGVRGHAGGADVVGAGVAVDVRVVVVGDHVRAARAVAHHVLTVAHRRLHAGQVPVRLEEGAALVVGARRVLAVVADARALVVLGALYAQAEAVAEA